jgi:hypothetical protein
MFYHYKQLIISFCLSYLNFIRQHACLLQQFNSIFELLHSGLQYIEETSVVPQIYDFRT